MKKLIFWLNKRMRMKKKKCGMCCLTCSYYMDCVEDE